MVYASERAHIQYLNSSSFNSINVLDASGKVSRELFAYNSNLGNANANLIQPMGTLSLDFFRQINFFIVTYK